MKKLLLQTSTVLSILTTITGCVKDGATGPAGATGPTGPLSKGNLAGTVQSFDQYGSRLFGITNAGGITVTLEGTGQSTTTDADGKYQFDSLSTGVYNLSFSKTGYGDNKIEGVQFLGGGTIYARNSMMSQIPVFTIANIAAVDTVIQGQDFVKIRGNLSDPDTRTRTLLAFLGTTSGVSSNPANYVNTVAITARVTMQNPNGTIFSQFIPAYELYNAGFTSGSTLYVAAYPAANNYNQSSSYQDFSNGGRSVYNAIGATASTANVIIP